MKIFLTVFIFIFLTIQSYSQLQLKVTTDKDEYKYGEKIKIICSVTNISDTTIKIQVGSYRSCQAEFEFNNFYSGDWTVCLPLYEELTFYPNTSRNYSWTIDPKIFGLPNKDGVQQIIGHYFFNDLADTIYFEAPVFMGGQLEVSFKNQNNSLINSFKDSLDIEVLSRKEYDWGVISELWQVTGIQIDTIYNQLKEDNRFRTVNYSRMLMYDDITVTSMKDKIVEVGDFQLLQNYPNPFNPETTIKYSIPLSNKNVLVTLKIYDILGKEIKTLINKEQTSGIYEVKFNGAGLASGVYLYKLDAGNFSDSKKFILMK